MSLLRGLLSVVLLFLSIAAGAHGYWIEVEGKHQTQEATIIRLYYGDYAMGEKLSGATLDKMKDIKVTVLAPGGYKEEVAMTQKADYWEGYFIPKVFGRYVVIGVNDTRDVQDWTKHNLGITRPVQYLKTTYDVGKTVTETPSPLFLDVRVDAKKKGSYTLVSIAERVVFDHKVQQMCRLFLDTRIQVFSAK